MELSPLAQAELRALVNRHDVSARIATRARIVLWAAEGRMKKDIAMLAGVSRPTVDFWIDRYGFGGVAALHDRPGGAPREQIPMSLRLAWGSGPEAVDLEASGDADDAGSIFAGGEVAGLLRDPGAGP